MDIPIAVLLMAVLSAYPSSTRALNTVYKCTATDGAVSFQDFPCSTNARAETVDLAEATQAIDLPAIADAPAPREPVADVSDETIPSKPGPPGAWLCVREDASRYLSDTGIAQRRAVPLAMLGAPQDGLAEVYSRGGAGLSAPGVRASITRRPASGSLGAAYVWIEDTCRYANSAQVCAFLDTEIEATERRLRYAFSDTSVQVKVELEDLRTRAAGCRR
ncbi:MAG: DUF4124 domain-containing protein [Dokdonella sp.]